MRVMHRSRRANKTNCALHIFGLALEVKIGISKKERILPQKILLDMRLSYPLQPKGCVSDKIEDVICYDKICAQISKFVEKKTFKLVENLAFHIYKHLQTCYQGYPLQVKVTKYPKINKLEGHVSFEIAD